MPYKPAPGKPVTLVYVGALPGVLVTGCGVTAERGVPVEIPADIAEGLLEQPTWRKHKKETVAAEAAETGE